MSYIVGRLLSLKSEKYLYVDEKPQPETWAGFDLKKGLDQSFVGSKEMN